MAAEYELSALRYAMRQADRHEHFIGGDAHDGPMAPTSHISIGNMETGRPFKTALRISEMLDAFNTVRSRAASPELIVPGQDPLVMRRYPAPSPEPDGIAVRLDVAPTQLGLSA